MLSEQTHREILTKFNALKGQKLIGKVAVKGVNKNQRVLPDQYVSEEHIMHDLIRGFYKPAKQPYLLSYLATESLDNYGEQIIWTDNSRTEFIQINMYPPNGEKDVRKDGDIGAARYNMRNNLPLGILHKVESGVYTCLGLGLIKEEREDGVFIVEPFEPEEIVSTLNLPEETAVPEITEALSIINRRIGQDKFRKGLLQRTSQCEICGITALHTRASHIKPWAVSENAERLDPENGLLLCPNHDHLFDKGYISFNKKGTMLISSELTDTDRILFNLNDQRTFEFSDKQKQYLDYHRKNIFKK